ncbi:unnamed protein product [Candidula unifasciata]|uniref:Non-structural maintenance of chromosomes element 4 n=1 Tax=Candidula unifasciata TaxID=100452 RepID=A0A8S3YX71_9EUPU|nr:unnamed protein product [Candidula unifasciata]
MASGNCIEVPVPEDLFDSKDERLEVLGSFRNRQNEEERRLIREGYRRLQEELAENRQDLVNPSSEQDLLTENVEKVDELFKRVQMTREGALDAANLLNISELGKTKAQALKTDFVTFSPADFCDKVKVKLMGNYLQDSGLRHENWVSLGRAVQPYFKKTPVLRYIDAVPRVVLKLGKQLSSLEETDRGELTTAQVEHLLNTLWRVYNNQNDTPICFFEFVTNPHSFGQTVENIFYASFLIRDGHARIFLDSDDLPVIEPIERIQEEKRNIKQTLQTKQIVLTITPEQWKEIVRVFEIEEPVITELKKPEILKEKAWPQNSATDSQIPNGGHGKGKGKRKLV